jgi:Mrp family chromosome partitioning ATPase
MQTVESLLEVGTQILGVVVNDAPTSKSRYGYYSGYSNHYRYGYYGSRKQQEDKDKQREEGEAALPDAA